MVFDCIVGSEEANEYLCEQVTLDVIQTPECVSGSRAGESSADPNRVDGSFLNTSATRQAFLFREHSNSSAINQTRVEMSAGQAGPDLKF